MNCANAQILHSASNRYYTCDFMPMKSNDNHDLVHFRVYDVAPITTDYSLTRNSKSCVHPPVVTFIATGQRRTAKSNKRPLSKTNHHTRTSIFRVSSSTTVHFMSTDQDETIFLFIFIDRTLASAACSFFFHPISHPST